MGSLGQFVVETVNAAQQERARRAKLTRWQRLCEDIAKPRWWSDRWFDLKVLLFFGILLFLLVIGAATFANWFVK